MKVDPNESGSWDHFTLQGGIRTKRYICTPQRRQNVSWFGAAKSALCIFSNDFLKVNSPKREGYKEMFSLK